MSEVGGHRARKRFGQNFLQDRHTVERIVAAVAPHANDNVVEIGPGLGALTLPLLARLNHLHVIEIDRDLAARLREIDDPQRLNVHETDALAFDFAVLGPRLRVVGNLPYNISTPLLFHLSAGGLDLVDMTFMLQKEVVDRIVAAPDTPAYGRLSVMLQYRFICAKLFTVPPGAFRPIPKVSSAIVQLKPHARPLLAADMEATFADLVRAAFGQRRKTLRNTLRAWLMEQDFARLGIDSGRRGETLAVGDFVSLTEFVEGRGRM
ncbi:MAG: 16S rRNA (adenine(1518)-N(6)/adenine(1519)-N(6))-dimethyltransferase RsmA [Rhodocyclaceae bacterium]|nr:16S rRNA (adenine(1518)-N(6)/adenine(1519)-N(6))-dimethyltransferase RsmA [Rhodocyclaceae bacterium]MBX3668875.1 16S rRNA (adenine(1518)-N(6)/adenine(1519)-N(6))-dimethyltransferase RsmA [Rhodocyclaceae bacterium]